MFKTTTADVRHAALLQAAGYEVLVFKKPASPRCLFEYEDIPETRSLINDYEKRRTLRIPPKSIFDAYRNIISACHALKVGAYEQV